MTMNRRYPNEIDGMTVPRDPMTGLPDPTSIVGSAAYLLADCDAADAEAQGYTDARNATGRVWVSTPMIRLLVDAAVAAEKERLRAAESGIEPSVRYHVTETRDGVTTLHDRTGYGVAQHAINEAREFNDEEADEARRWGREVKEVFGVVKATTTYEVVDIAAGTDTAEA